MPRLCISRIPGESVLIGDNVTVYVHAIRRGRVFLAVEAPAEIAVDRSEVRARKLRHTDGELEVMAGLIRGEPLYRLEAMARQVETLQRSIEYLRCENAELRAQVQDKEHVE